MYKKFKRLLGLLLAFAMLVGLVPLNGMTQVNAANDSAANMTVYLQVTDNWKQENAAFRAYLWETGHDSGDADGTYYKDFTPVSGENNLYSVTLNNKSCYKIKVVRCSSDYEKEWNSFEAKFYERSSDSINKIKVTDWNYGTWDGTYTPSGQGGEIPSDGIFYVDTDLVDYFNDSRVESGTTGYSADNQGDKLGDMKEQGDAVPFSYFNGAVSQLQQNKNYRFPLYFGALLFTNNRVGRTNLQTGYAGNLTKWSSTANIALSNPNPSNTDDNNIDASVQGLVDDTLGANGELLSNGQELPYFSKSMADSLNVGGNKVMEYYGGLQFPFKSQYDSETGVTKYSYDSATDYAVYRDWNNTNNKKLLTSENTILNNDDSNGYYPLNKEGESGAAVNYGFGTKFTIPFTINENGTIDGTKDGEPVTFSFTGDDDVWVFLDGKLILDMGGAHAKSSGTINFKDLTATVDDAATAAENNSQILQSGDTNELSSYQDKGLANWVWKGDKWGHQERSTVETSSKTLNFSTYGEEYASSFKDSSNTHTLVMFYMERGMYDSNMKIEFTINPLPSGLSLSKTLNTTEVNSGLVDEVLSAESDNFNFKIQTKDLKTKEDYTDVENLGYSLNNYNNQDTYHVAENSVISGVGARSYAHSFVDTETQREAFTGGTGFKISELQESDTVFEYDYSKTTWTVYDKENNYSVIKTNDENNRLTAEFDMGNSGSTEFDTFDYNVNFNNTPKTGGIKLTKEWASGQTAPAEGEYSFTILIDLDGEDGNLYGYKAYELDGDIDDTDANGNITLKSGQTVIFTGIPTGASYKITENIPEDASYVSDKEGNTVTGTIGESEATVTFTNRYNSKELDKVIYIEAGRTNGTDYTVTDPEDSRKVTVTGVGGDLAEGITATTKGDGTVNFKTDNADKKYEVSYTGTKEDGMIINGNITIFTYKATDKVYVFDYGLESNIAETTENKDGLFEGGVFYNNEAQKTEAYKTTATLDEISDSGENAQTDITADPEGVSINENGSSDGEVTFKPQAFMDQAENYTYSADVTKNGAELNKENPETGTVVNGTIKVMPANVVYYEDNFNSETATSDSSVKIIYEGNNTTEGTSVKLKQSNGQTEQYGHDDAYASGTTDSAGSSTKLTADGYNTKAEFTFTGTGFDVVARTTTDTAGIMYTVQKRTDEADAWSFVKTGVVDTYYANGDLYQIPVIHEEFEQKAQYKVTLLIKQTNSGSVVYLDGIRVYNPMGTDGEKGYIAGEKGASFEKVSDLILGDGEITETGVVDEDGSVITGQTINGAKAALLGNDFDNGKLEKLGYTKTEDSNTDAAGSNQTNSLLQYMHSGPNNEIYLDETASIAFIAEKEDAENFTLQIEAKLVNIDGQSKVDPESEGVDLSVWNGSRLEKVDTVKSSSAMYYTIDLTKCINLGDDKYLVVISGNSDVTNEGTASLSFSNLKYKGYTLANPLDEQYSEMVKNYINAGSSSDENKFAGFTGNYKIRKNQWVNYKYKVTMTEDVFNGADPEFTMYYTNYGEKAEITVTAQRVAGSSTEYLLRFRAPNAAGTFPIEIHYVIDGKESDEYLAASMKVSK